VDTTVQASDSFGAPMQVTLLNGSPNSGIGSVNYNLDGGSNMNGLRNTGNVAPNPDAVLEFRAITNSYSAEYGRFAGGVVDMVTKSGTNSIHDSLFEFLRNTDLNANRWLPGQAILRKDLLHRNQFGGSAAVQSSRIVRSSSSATLVCASVPTLFRTPPHHSPRRNGRAIFRRPAAPRRRMGPVRERQDRDPLGVRDFLRQHLGQPLEHVVG
jgi:hypothetical protein